MNFDHEKLDVYQAAIEFVALADDVVENLPRGRSYLADQLRMVSMLIGVIRREVGSGTGSGTGTKEPPA